MEEVINALKNIQRELNEQKYDFKRLKKVTEQVTQNFKCILKEKFKILDENYESLQKKNRKSRKKTFIEKQIGRIILFFSG